MSKQYSLMLLFFVLFFLQLASAKSILFLGDSYTIGTGLKSVDKKKAFPYQLMKELKKNNINIDSFKIYATDGDTTKHLLGALNVKEPQSNPDSPKYSLGNYDLVILSIGINDIFRGHTEADYEYHFKELLERAIHFAQGNASRVIVLSIPPWDVSPSVFDHSGTTFRAIKYTQVRDNISQITLPINAIKIDKKGHIKLMISSDEVRKKIRVAQLYNKQQGIAETINAFNRAAKRVIKRVNDQSNDKKIVYLDITIWTRKMCILNNKNHSESNKIMFSHDGIHYSPRVYKKWVDKLLISANQILCNI